MPMRNDIAILRGVIRLISGLPFHPVYDEAEPNFARPRQMSHEHSKDHMGPQLIPLPEYGNPPVSEVALSIEFLPLENWRAPHAGLYWSQISNYYTRTEVQAPIPSQIENLDEELWPRQALTFQMASPDTARTWFLSEAGTDLVQVQRDRFVINWRKVKGDEIYPRYEIEMRPRFEKEWGRFKKFVGDQKLGTIEVKQCEITYVNDIVRGEGWNTFPEALALFAHWLGRGSDGFLPSPETLNMSGSFRMANQLGRLHFMMQPVLRQLDNRFAVQLRLSARGKPEANTDQAVLAWMDSGREWIVRGFTDLTSKRAHEIWKRRR